MSDCVRIMDDADLIEIGFADVERYHGQHSIGGAALGYRVIGTALEALSATPLQRKTITIVSAHPGPGFRDAFELVTRVVTRGQYQVDTGRPGGRYNPFGDHGYNWTVSIPEASVDLVLRPDLIPDRFFELWHLLGADGMQSPHWPELVRVKHEVAETVLSLSPAALFEVR